LKLERFLAPAQLDPVLYAGRSLYLMPDGPAAEPGYAVLRAALVQRQRWALGRMVLGGLSPGGAGPPSHRRGWSSRSCTIPEQVRFCAVVTRPAPDAASEEMASGGMFELMRPAVGRLGFVSGPGGAGVEGAD